MAKQIKIAKTAEEWFLIESMGTYEQDYKNGSIWSFNGENWYLSHLELNQFELKKVNDMERQ